MEGCLVGCVIGLVLAVPVALLVVIMQGSAKRRGWQMVRGERKATIRQIDECLKALGTMNDAEAIELARRLAELRDKITDAEGR